MIMKVKVGMNMDGGDSNLFEVTLATE